MMKVNSAENHTPVTGGKDISAAVSTITAKGWMQTADQQKKTEATVSANDLTSLSALITYVAYHSGENEFGVARRLADRFNIPNVTCLPATQYDSAIRYLVDTMVTV